MLLVTDILGNSEPIIHVKGLTTERILNGEETLTGSVLFYDQEEPGFDLIQEESIVLFNGIEYVIKEVTERNLGQRTEKSFIAIRKFYSDLIDKYKYETTSGTKSITTLMGFIFDDTVFDYTIVNTFNTVQFDNFGDDNRLALFSNLLDSYGAEFELNGNNIIIRKEIGLDTDFQFRYNYNIKTINKKAETQNLTTYIKGFGQPITDSEGNPTGGYVVQGDYLSPNATLYGIREATPVRDDRVTNLTTLQRLMEASIQDVPVISIELDFIDLRAAGFPEAIPNLGDRVFIIYEPMKGVDYETRITSIKEEYDFELKPIRTSVTLANIRKDITDTLAQFSNTTKTVTRAFNPDGTISNVIIPSNVTDVVTAVNSALTELQFSQGILSVDPGNPLKRVRFLSTGLSTSVDGGVSLTPAITGDGINLDNSYGDLPQARVTGLSSTLITLDNRIDVLEGYLPSDKGTALARPTLGATDDGFFYYDQTVLKMILWNGASWVNMDGSIL